MLSDQACVYDFLFMDIELGSENGIDLGLKIVRNIRIAILLLHQIIQSI